MTDLNSASKTDTPKKYPLAYLLPLIAALAIIPAIVYMYNFNTDLTQYNWYQGPSKTIDFFLHTKMVWLLITIAVAIFIFAYMVFSAEIDPIWEKNMIPLAIYMGIAFISAFTSVNQTYSFNGIYEQFEPVWILLGYGFLLYYAYYIFHSEKAVKRFMPWIVVGIVIMCIIGLSQAFKHDIFQNKFIQNFMVSDKKYVGNIVFNFEKGRCYLSLYNPNYVGFYVSLFVPILIAAIMTTKKILFKIGYGILALSLIFILYASQSRSGIITLAFSFVIMLLCMRKVFIKHWMVPTIAIIIAVISFFGINKMNDNVLLDRMHNMFNMTSEAHPLESIVTDKDVAITYNGETIHFSTTQNAQKEDVFHVTDDQKKKVAFTPAKDATPNTITDPRFPFTFTSVRSDSLNGFQVTIDGRVWSFTNLMKKGDSTYYTRGLGTSLFKLKKHKKGISFLENHYSFANKRGYIWARTLPLLKKYFFIGSGPDTFTIAFPNDDLVGLYNSGHDNEIITRPHNMYLQIGVQTGVLSLLAFLTFFGWYIVNSIRLYWKEDYTGYLPKIGVAILTSVIAYLILGLTNDSCIAVAPIFYVITGMGLGINYHLKKEKKKENKLSETH